LHEVPLGMELAGRRRIAARAWWCELLTVLLTAVYCGIVGHDLQSSASARVSSPSWLRTGFCTSGSGRAINSHTVCCLADLILGGALALTNLERCRRVPHPGPRVAFAVAVFTVMHGLGHLLIGHVLGEDFMADVRPAMLPAFVLALYFLVAFVFLALGPYLGFCNGVSVRACAVLHFLSTWSFLQFVPTQFAFGFVQLYLNAWYCVPRVLFLGCTEPEAVAKRVDDGWAVVSSGFLLLMPVVFLEMLTCDIALIPVGGHVVYDATVIGIAAFHSQRVWYEHGCKRS